MDGLERVLSELGSDEKLEFSFVDEPRPRTLVVQRTRCLDSKYKYWIMAARTVPRSILKIDTPNSSEIIKAVIQLGSELDNI